MKDNLRLHNGFTDRAQFNSVSRVLLAHYLFASLVAAIALPRWHLLFCRSLNILSQRPAHIDRLLKSTLIISSNETLVSAGINQFTTTLWLFPWHINLL